MRWALAEWLLKLQEWRSSRPCSRQARCGISRSSLWDLADRTRREELRAHAAEGRSFGYDGDDIDVDDLMASCRPEALTAVAEAAQAAALGFHPSFQFITLHVQK